MYKSIFLDANVILDLFDDTRINFKSTKKVFEFLLLNNIEIFTTSCDILTTVYYIYQRKDKKLAIEKVKALNELLTVIEFSNKEVLESCNLMEKLNFKDLEDTLQYVSAKKYNCDLIITNDKNFISPDIKVFSTKEFLESFSK